MIFYPNIDAYNSLILNSINKFRKLDYFDTIKHLPLEGFVHTMGHCAGMIGNSSAGIREASSFGVPSVDFGGRQEGRERNDSVIDVECEYEAIRSAIKKGLDSKFPKTNIFYQDGCSKMIANQIKEFVK